MQVAVCGGQLLCAREVVASAKCRLALALVLLSRGRTLSVGPTDQGQGVRIESG